MVTKTAKNQSIKDIKFAANCAIVVKETINAKGEKSTTYVEFEHLKDRDAKNVFKCVIIGILSDETITGEMKAKYLTLQNEDGTKCELQKGESYTPPTFRRLIANFSENYKIGYSDNEGTFHAVHYIQEKQNLRSLLLINAKKIEEFDAASSNTRRAIVHTLSAAAIEQLTKEAKYIARYNQTAKAETAKPKAKKAKAKKAETQKAETAA